MKLGLISSIRKALSNVKSALGTYDPSNSELMRFEAFVVTSNTGPEQSAQEKQRRARIIAQFAQRSDEFKMVLEDTSSFIQRHEITTPEQYNQVKRREMGLEK